MTDKVSLWTGWAMCISAVLGAVVLVAGILLDSYDVTFYGIILMVVSPLAGIAVSMVALLVQREMWWVYVALLLIGIILFELVDWYYSAAVIIVASVLMLADYLLSRRNSTD